MEEEQIKLKCLELAIKALQEKAVRGDHVIDTAKDYYNYVITKTKTE